MLLKSFINTFIYFSNIFQILVNFNYVVVTAFAKLNVKKKGGETADLGPIRAQNRVIDL